MKWLQKQNVLLNHINGKIMSGTKEITSISCPLNGILHCSRCHFLTICSIKNLRLSFPCFLFPGPLLLFLEVTSQKNFQYLHPCPRFSFEKNHAKIHSEPVTVGYSMLDSIIYFTIGQFFLNTYLRCFK